MPESKHARNRPRWMPWAALGGALLIGGLAGGFIGAAINSSSASTTATTTPPNPSGPGWREVVIDGDTRFDMELVRR